MDESEKDECWLEEYIESTKEKIGKAIRYYEVRMEFWKSFIREFNFTEKVKTFNNSEEGRLIESISYNGLNDCSNFGEAVIAYSDEHRKGFVLKMEKENDNSKGYFLKADYPFSIEQKMVVDYYECEKQYFEECLMALENIEKSAHKVFNYLKEIKESYRNISDILEEDGMCAFLSPDSMIEEFLQRNE